MAREMKDSGIEWIGEIPEGWEVVRNKGLFYEVDDRCLNGSDYTLLSVSEYTGVTPRSAVIKEGEFETHAESLDGYKICKPGDIVMNIMLAWKRATAASNYEGIISPAYCVFRGKGMNTKFFHYLFRTDNCAEMFKRYSTGIIDSRLRLYPDVFLSLYSIVPPIAEQDQIVAFLDTECARIDAVIEQTRASIEEYKKLKQSIITQAVTKGIRPSRKMKASGNNDMGCIPNEWEIVRLKYLTTDIVDCPHETPEYSLDGEYFVIRTADQDYARLRSDANMFRLAYNQYVVRTRRMTLDKDDIVYGREGERWGLACIVPESGKYCLGQRMMQFRGDEKRILPLFAMYALSSSHVRRQGEYDTFGSTSPHVNISTIRNYRIPLPIISEQKEICEYIHEKVLYLDTLVDKKEKEVAELESHKKSLIFEYVTGKKEVGQ